MRSKFFLLLGAGALSLFAETGREAWLPPVGKVMGGEDALSTARLVAGAKARVECCDATLGVDGFEIRTQGGATVVRGGNDRGALYGAFALLRKAKLGVQVDGREAPKSAIRWVNEWNNLDGSIERGYAGPSIFWEGNKSREDLTRVREYARLLASLGIQACSINNVNANEKVITHEFLPQVARIADAMRPWGVRVAVSINFGSPKTIGGLDTFDPLDPKVAAFWKDRVDDLYKAVPDLAGFVLKADSEGRVGPAAYKRTHADAANMIARALKPHGGLLFYRGFVYDNHMDWNNPKNDRARAAWDNFKPLDGQFDDNVIIQVKNGPIDFQVREPASPLFGALDKTKVAIELQITQEYFGQARHTVFLAPYWKDVLDFDVRGPVKSRVGAFVGVSNVGMDENWTRNYLSQANLYAFGRLAWNPDLTSEQISDEWTRLTFGDNGKVRKVINDIQLTSWRTYENYTGPLGLQTLTDITGNHYSVNIEASERNGWGQWHFADDKGVGMNRTVANGTGYIGQYQPHVAKVWESEATCPDELLLFLHHVPYTHKLHSGKTVVQYLYDSHYEGAARVAEYVREWKTLKGLVDEQRYREVLAQLEYQSGQAIVWRDAVTRYFAKMSGIPDAKGRVGNYPGRTEAESMQLTGYTTQEIRPWEAASGTGFVGCVSGTCVATMKFTGSGATYRMNVQYFDMPTGEASYRVLVGGKVIDEWKATDRVPARRIDAGASARRVIEKVALHAGDEIRIEGTPDRGDPAALDYVEIEKQ
jgi:alpha-glucuronidase